jgi:hypothetical protein
MDPNNSIPHHLLGQAYRGVGRTEDAQRELKLAEQLQSAENPKPTEITKPIENPKPTENSNPPTTP